jgi:hypothetical protein
MGVVEALQKQQCSPNGNCKSFAETLVLSNALKCDCRENSCFCKASVFAYICCVVYYWWLLMQLEEGSHLLKVHGLGGKKMASYPALKMMGGSR